MFDKILNTPTDLFKKNFKKYKQKYKIYYFPIQISTPTQKPVTTYSSIEI